MMHAAGIALVHYVSFLGSWDWRQGTLCSLDLASALETWAEGGRLEREPSLRLFFGDGFRIKQFTIDTAAIRFGTQLWNRFTESAAKEQGDDEQLLAFPPEEEEGPVPDILRFGRVPLLATLDGIYSEERLGQEMLSGEWETSWLESAFAYVSSYLVDGTGTAYIPDCLLGTNVWLPAENWITARTPQPFWPTLLNDRVTQCEDDERGHYCFPQTLPQIEFDWSMSTFVSALRAWANNHYSLGEAFGPRWIIKHGVENNARFLSRRAYDELRDLAGSSSGTAKPYYCNDVWIDPYGKPVEALPVTEFFGLSALAAYQLEVDVSLGMMAGKCPQCGYVSATKPRQHRDRLCDRCSRERARTRSLRSKGKARQLQAIARTNDL
jgi:hypothetical protein